MFFQQNHDASSVPRIYFHKFNIREYIRQVANSLLGPHNQAANSSLVSQLISKRTDIPDKLTVAQKIKKFFLPSQNCEFRDPGNKKSQYWSR